VWHLVDTTMHARDHHAVVLLCIACWCRSACAGGGAEVSPESVTPAPLTQPNDQGDPAKGLSADDRGVMVLVAAVGSATSLLFVMLVIICWRKKASAGASALLADASPLSASPLAQSTQPLPRQGESEVASAPPRWELVRFLCQPRCKPKCKSL